MPARFIVSQFLSDSCQVHGYVTNTEKHIKSKRQTQKQKAVKFL